MREINFQLMSVYMFVCVASEHRAVVITSES